ncbi:MAG: hypothetical protein EG825_05875 [Rhodocyclaceae bacterium]|nr:hypothetical protein [Rhodocyclaceae bacterium]
MEATIEKPDIEAARDVAKRARQELKRVEQELKDAEQQLERAEQEIEQAVDEVQQIEDQLDRQESERKAKSVAILVNEQSVTLPSRSVTGAEIKDAAIRQGVLIQPNFVLQEELANGTSRIVGDSDTVKIHEHSRFTAIAPDDNS